METVYCARCGKERNWGSYYLDPEATEKYRDLRKSDVPKYRWCRGCYNKYWVEEDRWKGNPCPTCGQTTTEYDYCGHQQSKGQTCGDPNCRRCLGSRALTFDVT